MRHIIDIAANDLLQMSRDRSTYLFFLVMPVVFTFLFGYAFGGFSSGGDPRLPVGFQDQDGSDLSQELYDLLDDSKIIRLVDRSSLSAEDLQTEVGDGDLAAAIIVPSGYGHGLLYGHPPKVILIADTGSSVGTSIQSELLTAYIHLESAVRTAIILEDVAPERTPYDHTLKEVLIAWQDPPISVVDRTSSAIEQQDDSNEALAHTAPGMMLQFAIAGLLVSAQVIVSERKSRTLQRLLTTASARSHILIGHYLAIFTLIFSQFLVLLAFGQIFLKLNYLSEPLAVLLVAFTAALCIAALGLFIGVVAKSDEQAIVFSLVPMFLLAGLGGAWVPLEVTGETFRTIGHLSPIAWAMDGFKNITTRGLGIESVLLPAAALAGYAVLFFGLAAWRFQNLQEH